MQVALACVRRCRRGGRERSLDARIMGSAVSITAGGTARLNPRRDLCRTEQPSDRRRRDRGARRPRRRRIARYDYGTGRSVRLRATAGDAVLASSIFAASELGAGGIIEATASGDIIASGRFRRGPSRLHRARRRRHRRHDREESVASKKTNATPSSTGTLRARSPAGTSRAPPPGTAAPPPPRGTARTAARDGPKRRGPCAARACS